MAEYTLSFEENFLYRGSVEFRFRSFTKIINQTIANGIFTFSIDGVDQQVVSDHLLAGIWIPIQKDIEPGFHLLEWKYYKYNNFASEDGMEDLSADIEYIQIKGLSHSPR